jgi:putative membrane protein
MEVGNMRGFVWRWILNAVALYFTAFIIDGITISGIGAALVAALVWGFVNTIIRPLVNLVTLPINLLTVGLFTFVVNGFLLWLVSDAVNGFSVENVWIGILGAIVLSVASSALSALIADK